MEKGNGHDPSTTRMVEVLERIEGEIRNGFARLEKRLAAVEEDVHEIRADVSGLRNEVSGLRQEMRADLAERDEAHGELGARVARLEAAVFKKTGS